MATAQCSRRRRPRMASTVGCPAQIVVGAPATPRRRQRQRQWPPLTSDRTVTQRCHAQTDMASHNSHLSVSHFRDSRRPSAALHARDASRATQRGTPIDQRFNASSAAAAAEPSPKRRPRSGAPLPPRPNRCNLPRRHRCELSTLRLQSLMALAAERGARRLERGEP